MKRISVCCCFALLALAAGCVTAPPPEGATVSAYAVGDRGRVMFEEVVVSLPFRGANAPYQNLHIVPAAAIQVRKTTWSNPYELEGILRRLETRITARLSESLSSLGEQSLVDTPALRERALREIQALLDEALRQWEHGSEYRVTAVIANLYWTDASGGRVPQPQRGWLW